ncbi:DUF4350 domain-containing protein [Pseudactinotalea sp.]|uniref:DUF4350 domain-containing protein n=1 Tax=Pseudactinotalea sp. TaxID=1926260 RepID=UPI003B3A607E
MSSPAPTIVARGRAAGDQAPDGDTPAGRRRGVVVTVGILVLLVVAVIVSQLTQTRTSADPLAPDNPEPDGARATAQVLREQGVDVTYVRTTSAAIAEAEAGSTLLVLNPDALREVQQEAIAQVDADIVLVGLRSGSLEALTDRIELEGYASRTNHVVDCSDEHAVAAESITAGGAVVSGDVEGCFTTDGGALYASWTEGEQSWRVLTDSWMLSNEGLATAGNAALVFRSLGAHDRVVWYLPDPSDTFGSESLLDQFPLPGPTIVMLFLVGVALVLWRGRLLGPVVVEPLPVEVKASETTRGRGRLYRRAGAHAHAASALRAGFVARVAGRVGLPSPAGPDPVVEALARASGRSPDAITDVLYGPPPTDDESLGSLAHALDTLESEVQRA